MKASDIGGPVEATCPNERFQGFCIPMLSGSEKLIDISIYYIELGFALKNFMFFPNTYFVSSFLAEKPLNKFFNF